MFILAFGVNRLSNTCRRIQLFPGGFVKRRTAIANLVESLENRALFAFTYGISGTTLTATGSSSSETLTITQSGSTLTVTATGTTTQNFTGITAVVVNANGGNDLISADIGVSSSIPMTFNGGTGNDTLVGANANDSLSGGDGDDDVEGRGGNDSLVGGLNDDLIIGGSGNDALFGSDGNDSLRGDSGADTVRGEGGVDRVDEGVTAAVKITLDNIANDGTFSGGGSTEFDNITNTNEILNGGDGDDLIDATAVAYSVTLIGGNGNDKLAGSSVTDFIDGGAGDDTVIAGSGSDIVINVEHTI